VDPRIDRLADVIARFSLDVQTGENVLLDFRGAATSDLLKAVVTSVTRAGGVPFPLIGDDGVQRRFLRSAREEQVKAWGDLHEALMRRMQCYVRVNGTSNPFDVSDVPEDARAWERQHYMKRVHLQIRVPETKWVVLRYPTDSMAQQAGMSREAFEDLYFRVCNLDYARFSRAMDPLKELMERTDTVRLTARDTDVTLSIRGIDVVKCDGRMNLPDGEVYTAPVRDSVNGVVTYNAGSLYGGTSWDWIRLTFRDGKIVDVAAPNDLAKLEEIFGTDEGASYVGEFSFGLNPHLHRAMKDTLFDEKIYGSFHTALGQCYDIAANGNASAIHWDLVCIQTEEYGGGDVWFDGKLARRNGHWVHPDLEHVLSVEALTGDEPRRPQPVS
jgi:aminopeptidase